MGAAGLLALLASRPASRWYALLLAACVTLALNPRATGDPGWQLSFAAVAGILLLAPPIRGPLSALPRLLADGIAVTAAATLSTAPLVAHHFGTVPGSGAPGEPRGPAAGRSDHVAGMVRAALGQAAVLGGPIEALAGRGKPGGRRCAGATRRRARHDRRGVRAAAGRAGRPAAGLASGRAGRLRGARAGGPRPPGVCSRASIPSPASPRGDASRSARRRALRGAGRGRCARRRRSRPRWRRRGPRRRSRSPSSTSARATPR